MLDFLYIKNDGSFLMPFGNTLFFNVFFDYFRLMYNGMLFTEEWFRCFSSAVLAYVADL